MGVLTFYPGSLFAMPCALASCSRAHGILQGNGGFFDRVFQQAPETAPTVLPANLLAFFVGAAPVADADFIDS